MRSLSEPVVDDVAPGSVPTALQPVRRTPSDACSACSATSGPSSSSSGRCGGRRATASSSTRSPSPTRCSRALATMEREGGAAPCRLPGPSVRAEYVLTSRGRGLCPSRSRSGTGSADGSRGTARRSRDAAPAVRPGLRPGPDLQDVPRDRSLRRRACRVGAERVLDAVRAGSRRPDAGPTPIRPVRRGTLPGDDVIFGKPVVLGSHRRSLRGLTASATSWTPWARRRVSSRDGCGRSATSGCSRPGDVAGRDVSAGGEYHLTRRDTPSNPSSRSPSTGRSTGMPPRRGRARPARTCRAGRRSSSRSPATSARPSSTAATSRSSRGRPVERTGSRPWLTHGDCTRPRRSPTTAPRGGGARDSSTSSSPSRSRPGGRTSPSSTRPTARRCSGRRRAG